MPRRTLLLLLVVALAGLGGGAAWWRFGREEPLPEGIWRTHGRSEARRIDVATRFGGRLVEVLVREGDRVEAGAIVARLDASEVEARLREAEAALHQAEQAAIEARALEHQRESELAFAIHELERAQSLGERGFTPSQVVDLRRTQKATAEAALAAARAGVQRAEAAIAAARATVERIRSDLAEYTLRAPKAGRVQYRLAEPGEVLAPGARVVSLLDLADVYMVVFVPTAVAGRLRYGAEARIVFDAAPRWVVPASVSFVASEAQFTPRYVETEAEREKLMFRVQVRIPEELLRAHADVVKTGIPGTVYLAVDPDVVWPERLAVRLPDVRPG
ncbi:MAG: efflux RND transporter periplasmic adaptor subunit [Geminicoccaceae bacterium]|nr:efflux RND transporter periplasmic adaptor subunit [Geminicoccaceae bacterium]MCX8101097.1 efflux RND transporter periplasmic adaptor subunit [Geminicoccaceae bacterium]MDW8369943.1 efflux RND transporter periplasmic adaptor subunit [Geminicoccaceae bacterium]